MPFLLLALALLNPLEPHQQPDLDNFGAGLEAEKTVRGRSEKAQEPGYYSQAVPAWTGPPPPPDNPRTLAPSTFALLSPFSQTSCFARDDNASRQTGRGCGSRSHDSIVVHLGGGWPRFPRRRLRCGPSMANGNDARPMGRLRSSRGLFFRLAVHAHHHQRLPAGPEEDATSLVCSAGSRDCARRHGRLLRGRLTRIARRIRTAGLLQQRNSTGLGCGRELQGRYEGAGHCVRLGRRHSSRLFRAAPLPPVAVLLASPAISHLRHPLRQRGPARLARRSRRTRARLFRLRIRRRGETGASRPQSQN